MFHLIFNWKEKNKEKFEKRKWKHQGIPKKIEKVRREERPYLYI